MTDVSMRSCDACRMAVMQEVIMVFIPKFKLTIFLVILILSIPLSVYSQAAISPEEAINHIGQNQTVCGVVASAHYAAHSKGRPTFLNLDRPYPNQIFTAVIWGRDRNNFSEPPEEKYMNERIV